MYQLRIKRFTYEEAITELQASEKELQAAIRERHILVIDGKCFPPLALRRFFTMLEGISGPLLPRISTRFLNYS